MKALVLLVGCLGAIGFFEPYFHDGSEPLSAYQIASSSRTDGLYPSSVVDDQTGQHMSRGKLHRKLLAVPFYFVSALVFLFAGFRSIVVGRFSFIFGLGSASAALLALGGYMHELNAHHVLMRGGGTHGATLLLISGLLGLVGSIVVLVKREPAKPKPPKPPPDLPVARVIS